MGRRLPTQLALRSVGDGRRRRGRTSRGWCGSPEHPSLRAIGSLRRRDRRAGNRGRRAGRRRTATCRRRDRRAPRRLGTKQGLQSGGGNRAAGTRRPAAMEATGVREPRPHARPSDRLRLHPHRPHHTSQEKSSTVSKNVAMFVDVANMYYAARGQDVDVDYVALLKHATKGRDLIRAYAYTGLDPENENQRKFIDFLAKNGYKPVVKDIRKFGDGRMKANLDIELVVDLFRLADRMDIAVIVSGDGDFAPAIRALQDKGIRCDVISFRPNTSSDLIAVADEFIDIMKIASIGRDKKTTAATKGMSAPEMPAKEVVPEFGFREASPAVAAAALAALSQGKEVRGPARAGRGRGRSRPE